MTTVIMRVLELSTFSYYLITIRVKLSDMLGLFICFLGGAVIIVARDGVGNLALNFLSEP